MIRINIPGEPRGKGRPRSTINKGRIRVYTDAKTRSFEELIAWSGRNAMASKAPMTGPMRVYIACYCTIPKSRNKAQQADALAGRSLPMAKPDLDNVVKAILDGLNGIVWIDDSQVVTVTATKRYSPIPCMVIEISEENLHEAAA